MVDAVVLAPILRRHICNHHDDICPSSLISSAHCNSFIRYVITDDICIYLVISYFMIFQKFFRIAKKTHARVFERAGCLTVPRVLLLPMLTKHCALSNKLPWNWLNIQSSPLNKCIRESSAISRQFWFSTQCKATAIDHHREMLPSNLISIIPL